MTKAGYNKLLQKYQESLAANEALKAQIRERDDQIIESRINSDATATAAMEEPSLIEDILRIFEHGAFLAVLGIAGPVLMPLSNWFLLLTAGCFGLAFHRSGFRTNRTTLVQIGGYLLACGIGAFAGLGIHVAIEKQERELVSRIAALFPKEKPVESASTIRAYDLPLTRWNETVRTFAAPLAADTVRVGCLAWSERACTAAGEYLVALSKAGWKIDHDRVFRGEPSVPFEGVSFVSHGEPGPRLPPHRGRWHEEDLSEVSLRLAFVQLGLKSGRDSADSSLPDGVIGVYFGTEPASGLTVNKDVVVELQAIKYSYEFQSFSLRQGPDRASEEERRLEKEVAIWLETNVGKMAADGFRSTHNSQERARFINGLIPDLHKKANPE